MEAVTLTSILVMMRGLDSLYSIFKITQNDFLNTLIPTSTYLVII